MLEKLGIGVRMPKEKHVIGNQNYMNKTSYEMLHTKIPWEKSGFLNIECSHVAPHPRSRHLAPWLHL